MTIGLRFFLLVATWLSSIQLVIAIDTPVFGILTQPLRDGSNETMIAASYVKWLEAGGARSIPIPYDASPELVEEIFSQIDGILFTGGASDLPESAIHLWKTIHLAHSMGDFVPVWGTCLGFEFLLQLATQDTSILEDGYVSENVSLPLENVVQDQLYTSRQLLRDVRTRNITMNNHMLGIPPEKFLRTSTLTKRWKITSTNHDANGKEFVSTMEPIRPATFPVYGVQFHPEKNPFEYASYPHTNIPYEAIDHSEEGIRMSLYMSNFLVRLAKQNPTYKRYHTYDETDRFPLVYTYRTQTGIKFEQIYRIPPASHWDDPIVFTERA